ncbi:hypothetical protein AB0F18_10270 [Streptomyces sp. NPDC029216]|uniref:hypothetical protein n=1 Tax=Streptomyces sp. NPDC029216 TaxID=3154701 RepID=UPI0034028B74
MPGALCLLGCPCGIDTCWPLLARVQITATEVTWSGSYQIHRPEWGELPLGPYVSPRPAYGHERRRRQGVKVPSTRQPTRAVPEASLQEVSVAMGAHEGS